MGPDPAAVKKAGSVVPVPAPPRSGSPGGGGTTMAELMASMAADPRLRAAGVRLESEDLLETRRRDARAAFAAAERWGDGAGWGGAWLEQRLGGLRVSVPGSWRREANGQAWEVPGRAMVSVHMFGFEKKAPSVAEYLEHVVTVDRGGYERGGVRAVKHPHDDAPIGSAMELFEHAPRPVEWPVRWLRFASWSGTALLCLKLDADGLVGDDLGADFARTWRALR